MKEKVADMKNIFVAFCLATLIGGIAHAQGKKPAVTNDGPCTPRISVKNVTSFTIIPSGFTGRMTCNADETKKIFAKLQEKILMEKPGTVDVDFSDLEFYPALREELAQSLSKDKDWNSLKGKSRKGTALAVIEKNLAKGSLKQLTEGLGLTLISATIENLKIEDHRKHAFTDIALKGRYPFSGKIRFKMKVPDVGELEALYEDEENDLPVPPPPAGAPVASPTAAPAKK